MKEKNRKEEKTKEERIRDLSIGVLEKFRYSGISNLEIISFISSLLVVLKHLKENKVVNIYRYPSVLEVLIMRGLEIPSGMEKRVDENFIRALMEYTYDNIVVEEYIDLYDCILDIMNKNQSNILHETPNSINHLIVKLLGSMDDSIIYDGCAGVGKTLECIAKHNKNARFLCQEINEDVRQILRTRLELLGVVYEVEGGSTLLRPAFVEQALYDCAVMDWPYGSIISREEYDNVRKMISDQRNVYIFGEPSQASSIFVIMQQVIYSLKENGKAIFIIPASILFKDGKDGEVRKRIVKRDIIETIISLPSGLISGTSIPLYVIIFNKMKENINQIQMINVQQTKSEENKNRTKSDKVLLDVERIVEAYQSKKEEPQFSKNVNINEIDEKEYRLLAENYFPQGEETVKTNYFSEIEIKVNEIVETLKKNHAIKLQDVAEKIYKGANILKAEDIEEGEIKVLNMSGLKDDEIDYADVIRISAQNDKFRQELLLQENDILLSCKGEAIKIAHVNQKVENYTVTQSTMIIRPSQEVNPKYLELYLSSPLGRYLLKNIQKGAFIPMISLRDLETIKVIVPSLDEQNRIVQEFETKEKAIQAELAAIQRKRKDNRQALYEKMGIEDTYVYCPEEEK